MTRPTLPVQGVRAVILLLVSEPDLFVICKSCSSQVSPYVTECPYCGQRVRKRAPKLERESPAEPQPRSRSKPRQAPRLRRRQSDSPRRASPEQATPWVAPDTRPYGIFTIIGLSLLTFLVTAVRPTVPLELGVVGPLSGGDWMRVITTPFVYDNAGYAFIALIATGIFGMHLERRFGRFAGVAVFLLAGAAGAALSEAVGFYPAIGANGAALGLLTAWLVEDRRAHRRGEDRGSDLLGTYVIAVVLVLLSVVSPTASIAAAAGGILVGAVFGLLLPALIKR